MKSVLFTGLLALVTLSTGCDPARVASVTPEAAITNYPARGVVQAVRPDGKTIVIKHEEIPGYMKAMTMPIAVKDRRLMSGLASNDIVQFKLIVTRYGVFRLNT